MEIAIGKIGVFLKANNIEDIVSVSYFPRINVWSVLFTVIPEEKRVPAHIRHIVRMAGDNQGILAPGFKEYLLIVQAGRDKIFHVKDQNMGGLIRRHMILGYLNAWNNEHAIFIESPRRFFPDMIHIARKIICGNRIFKAVCEFTEWIITINDMVGYRDNVKAGLSEKVDCPSELYSPI
jgi:hypothetical protein